MLKVVPQDSAERDNVRLFASKGLPLVPVVNVIDNFRMVLGRWMSIIVMPCLTPLMNWMEGASSEALLRVVASICEVCCAFLCSVLAALG